jgi:Tetracyclin repressor-like, C-terminal domain
VVLAALERVVPDRDVPAADDPAADVVTGLRLITDATTSPVGRLLAGLLPELTDDPELTEALRNILSRIRGEQRERVRRLVGDGPDLDVRPDLGPAHLLLHGPFLGRSVTDDEIGSLVAITAPQAGTPRH